MIQETLIDWSRAQFALTACYHWLFVPLTLGLAVVMAIMESVYVRTQNPFWKTTAQFWQKIFGINFAIGVATGIILEFEFGTNWSNYSWFVGDIFGAPLAIEGILAFFMEATFIAVMFFGWNKVSQRFHLLSTWLTGIGATISAWWILVANSWMQHPVGMVFNPDTVRNEMVDFIAVAFQPTAITKFFHTVSSGWMTGAVFVVGISCWYLLKNRNRKFALASIKVGSAVGLVAIATVMFTGDRSAIEIAHHQPMKLAAAEGLEYGGKGAAFSIIPGVEIPGMLSILATHDIDGIVPGTQDILNGYTNNEGEVQLSADEKMERGKRAVNAFAEYRKLKDTDSVAAASALQTLNENADYFGYGHIKDKNDLVPNVTIVYWAFRVMVGGGCLLTLVLILSLWFEHKGTLTKHKWLLYLGVLSIPLVFMAGQSGWIVAEVGRQPWAIQDLLPVGVAVSKLDASSVQLTFGIFAVLFTILLIAEVRIMCKAIKNFNIED